MKVINGYSSQECGTMALQCPDADGYHAMSETLIVEVLDDDGEPCAPGETGRIVVTDLHNLASPRHWPLVGFHYFGDIAPVRQYQMIQETVDRITVRFVTDEPLTDDQRKAFTSLIQGALGYPFQLDIRDQRERLPRQTGGKFEEFISRVA